MMRPQRVLLLSLGTALLAVSPGAQGEPQLYLNALQSADHPADANPGWHEDAQGVTHDASHWYFTQTDFGTSESRIFKVPVHVDLDQDLEAHPSVLVRDVTNDVLPYNHIGDPAHYQSQGTDYIVVPLQGLEPRGIAVFRATDLSLVGIDGATDSDGGWCTVRPDGNILTANIVTNDHFMEWSLDWPNVESGVVVTHLADHTFTDENGQALTLPAQQGGDLSPDGRYLYFSNGTSDRGPLFGIHVFDTETWRRVAKSASGLFELDYSAGWPDSEEPEGLCIWDLDGGQAPGISGQLHFVLLDNDHTLGNDDDIWFKHYTNKVFVDPAGGSEPFTTVAAGANAAFPGATLAIKAGSYNETLTLSKWMVVTRNGGTGPVVIGQ